jgi:tRNA(adenine34) deaminase
MTHDTDTEMAADDERWMRLALDQAHEAHARGDWPTGAVIVRNGALLSAGQNRQNTQRDPIVHAETDAIHTAAAQHGVDALRGATLYCTMEPCPMCAGALKLAGVGRVVLALRHARLRRADLGSYTFEAFCSMTGFDVALTQDVLTDEYLALRLAWGGDAVKPG